MCITIFTIEIEDNLDLHANQIILKIPRRPPMRIIIMIIQRMRSATLPFGQENAAAKKQPKKRVHRTADLEEDMNIVGVNEQRVQILRAIMMRVCP
jgi:hypothetical protein